jgi:hypothetical protein
MKINWHMHPEWQYGRQAIIGEHELIAFDYPMEEGLTKDARPADRRIGWEMWSGPGFETFIAQGDAASLEEAMTGAERALGFRLEYLEQLQRRQPAHRKRTRNVKRSAPDGRPMSFAQLADS